MSTSVLSTECYMGVVHVCNCWKYVLRNWNHPGAAQEGRGRQPDIWADFRENCMKMNKFYRGRAAGVGVGVGGVQNYTM